MAITDVEGRLVVAVRACSVVGKCVSTKAFIKRLENGCHIHVVIPGMQRHKFFGIIVTSITVNSVERSIQFMLSLPEEVFTVNPGIECITSRT
jgi:hypothetical protein